MANAIDTIEQALRERYNVASLSGVGVLAHAIAAARAGDTAPLRDALDGRELYRWHHDIHAALAELAASAPVVAAEVAPSASVATEPAFAELDGTVAEVVEWLESIEDTATLDAISEAEIEGKDRKGVHDAIEAAREAIEAEE